MIRHFVTTFLIASAVGLFVSPSAKAEAQSSGLTRKEAKRLLHTANTPEQHRVLAEFLKEQANELRSQAREYEEIAAGYDRDPGSRVGYKGATPGQRYHALAEVYEGHATKADKRAASEADRAKTDR